MGCGGGGGLATGIQGMRGPGSSTSERLGSRESFGPRNASNRRQTVGCDNERITLIRAKNAFLK